MNDHASPVKKTRPYPIEAQLAKGEGGVATKGQIAKLVQAGFLLKTATDFYKVGDIYVVKFIIPAMHHEVNAKVRVIKTYDGMERKNDKLEKTYTVEFHFVDLPYEDKSKITSFVKAIGQK